MMNEIFASYLIPESRFDQLEKAVIKLAKRINSGKTCADYAPTIEARKDVIMVGNGTMISKFNPESNYDPEVKLIPYVWVTLKYQQPTLNGWHMVAVYDFETTPDGHRTCFVSTVPNMMVPKIFREIDDHRCDHCNTKRKRNKSMLMTQNFFDHIVVGSSCIKDFLGHKNPDSFMDVFKFEQSIDEWSREEPNYGGSYTPFYSVKYILELSAMFIRTEGYVKVGDWDNIPTTHNVSSYINSAEKYWIEYRNENAPTDSDTEMAHRTMEWIRQQPDSSDYMSTLHKCIDAGAITVKRFGVLISSVHVSNNSIRRAIEAAMPTANEWIGDIKERLRGIVATVHRVNFVNSEWGQTTIITFHTGTGNEIVWMASTNPDVEVGDIWTFDATVKEHCTYKTTRQTRVLRLKYEIHGQGNAA